jgi:hypothetical protein
MRQFLKLGQLRDVDGPQVFNRAYDVIGSLSGRAENPMKLSAYDALVKIAREQIARPDEVLSTAEIENILSAGPTEKSEVEKVIDGYKRLYSLRTNLLKDNSKLDVAHINDALLSMGEQIESMGERVPPMTKDDKTLAAAEKILADRAMA